MGQEKHHVLVLTLICKTRLYYKTWFETNSNIFNFFATESPHFRKHTQLKNKESVSKREYRNLYIRIIRMEGSRQ